jgi:hypothetical protein
LKVSLGNQTVANVGLFYVCYRLSRLGWNVMPTARNARGVDIVAYSQDASRKITLQVKSLSKRSPVPLGSKLDHLFADFIVICRYVDREQPECFILTPNEVEELAHRGVKDQKISYWLQPKKYETAGFMERWDRVGFGTLEISETKELSVTTEKAVAPPKSKGPTSGLFRLALQCRLDEAGRKGNSFLDVVAGDLHREVGRYPGDNHRMPVCCDVLRKSMLPGDVVIAEPPKGRGASLTVRFQIPRG